MIHDGIAFHNVSELEPRAGGALMIHRLPQALRDGLGIPGHQRGRFYAHRLTGVELRFVVESPFVAVTLMALEADTHVVVFRGDFAHARHELKAGVATTLFLEDPAPFALVEPGMLRAGRFDARVWRIAFHQDARACYLGRETYGTTIRPPAASEVPSRTWVAYGSSITYGANALHGPNAYIQQTARRLGVDVHNLGLPGSCMAEPAMAAHLAGRADADLITCELGVNTVDWLTAEDFAGRVRHLLATVADARPARPVGVIDIYPNRAHQAKDPTGLAARNTPVFARIVADTVRDLARPNLHHIEAATIVGGADWLTTDLLHPSDDGHVHMGERLAAALRPLLP